MSNRTAGEAVTEVALQKLQPGESMLLGSVEVKRDQNGHYWVQYTQKQVDQSVPMTLRQAAKRATTLILLEMIVKH